ncbi:hypothetical protein ABDI30_11965 [Paenibacillus cisolokensis]|uniref:hypothetical protein n=1 Tax=Paenibacillus cisolokensis TaxID=1658519 RepID=UPI003D2DC9A9
MKLWEYRGRRIRVVDIDEQVIEGDCTDYTPADENEVEVASIGIVTEPGAGYAYELYENEIKSIEIIE